MLTSHSSLLVTIAGIAFFMYGMNLASEALEKLAANRVRDILKEVTRRPWLGLVFGSLMTALLQSSGAVITMLVGLGSANVISLSQVMSLILGATIGTTITVQIISFNIAQWGLPFFAIAYMVYFLNSKRTLRLVMQVFMGFGLLFYGMEVISWGTSELRHVEMFNSLILSLKESPLMAIAATAFFTAVVHSSAVTIGFAMSLTGAGILNMTDSVYWIFGANIGTTATALIASMGGNYVGRQVAWAHCFFKVIGVAVFYPLVPWLVEYVARGQVERDIANIHTVYNLIAAIGFLPGIKWGAHIVEQMFPPKESEREFSVEHLTKADWQSPSVGIAHAEREVLRMGDIVLSMIQDSLQVFRKDDQDLVANIRKRDDRVDMLNREINLYLAKQTHQWGAEHQLAIMRLMSFSADLESTADVIDNQLLDLASKKHALKIEFSVEGWQELEEMYRAVTQIASLSLTCFMTKDPELAAKVIFHKRNVRKLEKRMRESHMKRLVQGNPDTISTSSVHLDVLSDYRRVAGLMANHCYSLARELEHFQIVPRNE